MNWDKSSPNTHICLTPALGCPEAIKTAYVKRDKFLMPLPVSKGVKCKQERELVEDYWCVTDRSLALIRKGFRYSASIPRIFWPITGHPFDPAYEAQTLVHDALCQSVLCPRSYADYCLREGMEYKTGKFGHIKAGTFWFSVRLGGMVGIGKPSKATTKNALKYVEVWAPYGERL